jgi:hypothetical protein
LHDLFQGVVAERISLVDRNSPCCANFTGSGLDGTLLQWPHHALHACSVLDVASNESRLRLSRPYCTCTGTDKGCLLVPLVPICTMNTVFSCLVLCLHEVAWFWRLDRTDFNVTPSPYSTHELKARGPGWPKHPPLQRWIHWLMLRYVGLRASSRQVAQAFSDFCMSPIETPDWNPVISHSVEQQSYLQPTSGLPGQQIFSR